MDDKVTVPRADIAAVIEDIRLGCPSVAVKHLTAMLDAPIANPDCVMVPREPTSQMLDAARGMRSAGASDAQVYRLMLSAAPLHPRSAAAEPVAWQYRLIGPSGPTKWRECDEAVRAMISTTGHYDGGVKVPAELRPLYAALPTESQKRG